MLETLTDVLKHFLGVLDFQVQLEGFTEMNLCVTALMKKQRCRGNHLARPLNTGGQANSVNSSPPSVNSDLQGR